MAGLGKDGVPYDPERFDPRGLLLALEPVVQQKAHELGRRCAQEHGIVLRVTQGKRDMAAQAAIYAQGRTTPGAIVSNARPGYSWHNFGRAFDVCLAGAVPYPDPDTPNGEAFWSLIGKIGEECGLEWGGDWKNPDRPHFEDRGGMTLASARTRYGMEDTRA